MNRTSAKSLIEERLTRLIKRGSTIKNAYFMIHSDNLNIHWNMACGNTKEFPARPEQPYHTASIAKTFTAVLIAMMVDERKLNYDDPISKYLPEDLMKGIHIYNGKDYSNDIIVEHLVSCTSGLPDFYEEKPKQGKYFLDLLLDNPTRYWTPEETIQWTKTHLTPLFPPGKKCHYSNTGYNLLGLIIERIMSKPYHEVLHEYIFDRLNMNHTFLSHYSTAKETNEYPIANIIMKKKEINVMEHISFSSIYAGGQTVSTSEDLLKFMKALTNYKLISKQSLTKMMKWKRLWVGVDYGYGLMRIRMLPFTQKYNVWGHLGSIGSFMLYSPKMGIYIIGNLNSTGYVSRSIRFIFSTLWTLNKLKD